MQCIFVKKNNIFSETAPILLVQLNGTLYKVISHSFLFSRNVGLLNCLNKLISLVNQQLRKRTKLKCVS